MSQYDTYIDWKEWKEELFLKYSKEVGASLQKELGPYISEGVHSILEIGFGNGEVLGWLRNKNKKVEGVEINKDLVVRANEQGIIAYENIFDVTGKIYDVIIALDVLEHIKAENLESFFRHVSSLLTENGLFIVRFPNGDSPFALPTQNGDLTHVTSVGWNRLHHLSKISGLQIVEYRGERLYSKSFIKKFLRLVVGGVRNFFSWCIVKLYYPGMPAKTVTFSHVNIVSILKKISNSVTPVQVHGSNTPS